MPECDEAQRLEVERVVDYFFFLIIHKHKYINERG